MKTIKTYFVILTLIGFSANSFAKQGGLLGKAKEAAAKKKDSKPVAKMKKPKGGKDDMAVKGTGVPASATTTKSVPTTTTTPTNK
jgi:hypothetical protein